MPKTIIYTDRAPKTPATHSQAVKCAGLVFVSGTFPLDPATGAIVGETIQEQTRQCLQNITAVLAEAGTTLEKAVSATVILADGIDFAAMNEEWVKWFPTNPPARQGAKIPIKIPGMLISIALIAEAE
jgi:2-iminobutanoate/2-iminopropanoate deaminase